MSAISIGIRLMFSPTSIEIRNETTQSKQKLMIGGLLGLIGFVIQGMYIFPRDEINFGDFPSNIEGWMNTAVGAVAGLVLFFMLVGFDALMVGIMGIRGYKNELYGSYAPFLIMPLVSIPIHAMFADQLSMRGYSIIIYIIIIIFLTWHAYVLAVALAQREERSIRIKVMLLLLMEISLGLIFITYFPLLFGATGQQFLEEYF